VRSRWRLVTHRIFKPNPNDPIDYEAAIEATLADMAKRFLVRKIWFDPWQMQSTAQRLTKRGLPIQEFPQSPANLTAASQNLFDLVQGRNLIMYPFEDLRLAVSRAVAVETARGWRIAKEKASHKIDAVVALAIACHAAVSVREPEEVPIVMPWYTGKNSGERGAGVDYMPAPPPPEAPPIASAPAPAPLPVDDPEFTDGDVPVLVKSVSRPPTPPPQPPQPTPKHLLKNPNATPTNPPGRTPDPWMSPFGGGGGNSINSPNFSMRDKWSPKW
jgi:hypothetical protein